MSRFGDVFLRCEAAERLEPAGEVVGNHKVGEVRPEVAVALVRKRLTVTS